jgi:hypothetical protein
MTAFVYSVMNLPAPRDRLLDPTANKDSLLYPEIETSKKVWSDTNAA